MLRVLHIAVVLSVVASSALAAVPCVCADMVAAVHEPAAPDDESDCCAGVDDEAPAAPEHECPRCATGQCDEVATLTPTVTIEASATAVPVVPTFTVAHVWGERRAPVLGPETPAVEPSAPDEGAAPALQRDTYARIRVIRC